MKAERARLDLEAHYRAKGWWLGERLVDRFQSFVLAQPNRLSVADDSGVELSRRELWDEAGDAEDVLFDSGVRPGDVVLIDLANSVNWQIAFLGVLRLGAVPATLPITTDEKTLAYMYKATAASAIIVQREWRKHDISGAGYAAAVASGTSSTVVTVENNGDWNVQSIEGKEVESVVPAAVTHIMFTSSTTGLPKIVMHTEDTLAAANIGVAQRYAINEGTPIFMPSPLGHSVGAWHGARFSLFLGAPLVLQDIWNPVRGLELVDRYQCAFTAAATPFLNDIVNAEWPSGKKKLASLKTFICGGAPVPPVLMERARKQAPNTLASVLWGMTEGTGTTCTSESTDEQLTQTAGKPLPGLEMKILTPDDQGIGELAIRGPQLLVGYLGQDDLYQSLMTADGYFRTGDLARIGDDGYLRLAGRKKELIIRGGVNISPGPIEDAIAAHPSVLRVAVIGCPDERLGERICAVITVRDGSAPTLEELNQWLREQGLSDRKLPESLVVVDDMPVTAAGKIRKIDLARQLEEAS